MNTPYLIVNLIVNLNNILGMGSCLAMIISWSLNKSILWAMLHGIFGWFYVIYYFIILKTKTYYN